MYFQQGPFSDMPLEDAIALRWSLRDVQARRLTITPLDPRHRDILMERGLIMVDDEEQPILTESGRDAIGLSASVHLQGSANAHDAQTAQEHDYAA